MKKLLNKKVLMCLGLTLGCASALILSIDKDSSSKVEASNYSTNSVPKNLNLNDTSASDIREYYSSLNSLSTSERQGTNLLKNLKPILKNGQKYFSYAGSATTAVWQAYEIVDRDWVKSPASSISGYNASTGWITNYSYGSGNSNPGSNPYVHALYVNRNVENETRAWGNHNQDQWGINQEHLWAKSNGFQSESPGTGARGDMMHLWAGNGRVNGDTHSNYFYGYVDTTKTYDDAGTYASTLSGNRRGTSRTLGGTQTVFEPQDSDKGDIARAIFYMAARYNYLSGSDSDGIDAGNPNLEIVNALKTDTSSYDSTTTKTGKMGILQDLLEWNRLDPPDAWEIHRNNLLFNNFTKNRNPFIDFPEWAEYVWGKSVSGSYNSSPTGFATPSSNNINLFGNGTVNPNPSVVSVTVSPNTLKLDLNKTATANLTVTINVTNGASQNVTWESSNSSVVTVSSSGVVTGLAVGTCTITATSELDSTKYGECAVTVVDSSQGLSTGHKYKLGWGAASGEEGTYTNFADVSGSVNDLFSFTTSKNGSSSAPAYNANASELRLYYGAGGNGCSITIVPEDGITITDAVIKTSTDPLMGYSVDGGSVVTISKENSQFTIEDISVSSSLTLQNVNTTNTQLRISTIELTYSHAGGLQQKNLSSISLDSTSAKTNYYIDDDFTYNGLIVTAHYDDNSESVVSPNNVSTPDMSTAGTKVVTVTYSENSITKTATYEITVSEPVATSITANVSKVYHPGDTILACDIEVEDNLGNEVVDFDFEYDEYMFTYDDAEAGGQETIKLFSESVSYGSMTCSLEVTVSRNEYVESTSVSDTLSRGITGITGTSYGSWSGKTLSNGVTYAGQSAGGNNSIQLRSSTGNGSEHSGIFSTANTNNLTLSSISLTWSGSTTAGRKVSVYADATPYSSAEELYDDYKGTYIGEISYGTTSTLNIPGSFKYIGLRSSSGALYLEEIEICYGGGNTAENISNYIMYEDTDGQCESKLDIAKGYFEGLIASEQEIFMTSSEYVIASARERLIAWATHEGKSITTDSNGKYVISNSIKMTSFGQTELNDDNSIIILFTVCSLGASTLSAFYLLRKKKSRR